MNTMTLMPKNKQIKNPTCENIFKMRNSVGCWANQECAKLVTCVLCAYVHINSDWTFCSVHNPICISEFWWLNNKESLKLFWRCHFVTQKPEAVGQNDWRTRVHSMTQIAVRQSYHMQFWYTISKTGKLSSLGNTRANDLSMKAVSKNQECKEF